MGNAFLITGHMRIMSMLLDHDADVIPARWDDMGSYTFLLMSRRILRELSPGRYHRCCKKTCVQSLPYSKLSGSQYISARSRSLYLDEIDVFA